MIQPKHEWTWPALVTRVVDGDTIDVELEQGFGDYKKMRFRLARVDTPELRSRDPEERKHARLAKKFVEELLLYQYVIVKSEKTGKYGRWLAEIWLEEVNVNDMLIDEGWEYQR